MLRRFIAVGLAALIAAAAHVPALAATEANKASQAELESIKGIGPGLSTRILQARAAAPFKDWADLIERVPGVGPGNAARYAQAGLTVAGAGFDKAATAAPERKAAAEKSPAARKERMSDGEVKASRKPRAEAAPKS